MSRPLGHHRLSEAETAQVRPGSPAGKSHRPAGRGSSRAAPTRKHTAPTKVPALARCASRSVSSAEHVATPPPRRRRRSSRPCSGSRSTSRGRAVASAATAGARRRRPARWPPGRRSSRGRPASRPGGPPGSALSDECSASNVLRLNSRVPTLHSPPTTAALPHARHCTRPAGGSRLRHSWSSSCRRRGEEERADEERDAVGLHPDPARRTPARRPPRSRRSRR